MYIQCTEILRFLFQNNQYVHEVQIIIYLLIYQL